MLGSEAREIEDAKVCKSSSVLTFHLMSILILSLSCSNIQKEAKERSGNIAVVVAAFSMVLLAFAVVGLKVLTLLKGGIFLLSVISYARNRGQEKTSIKYIRMPCLLTQVFLTHSPPNITFVPLPQKTNSPITYTGHGYIPCDG